MRIAVDVILIVLGFVFLVFGIRDAINKYKSSITPDNVLFVRSYSSIGEDNPYKYVSIKEANEIIEKHSGVIFVGFPGDSWSQVLVAPLKSIVESYGVDTIYYLEKLENDDMSDLKSSVQDISTPHIIVVKDGEILKEVTKTDIVREDYDGAPIEYFDEENTESLSRMLEDIKNIN